MRASRRSQGGRGIRGSAAAALGAVLVAGGLAVAGCADEGERYCDAVGEHQEDLAEVAESRSGYALLEALPAYRDLAAQAPTDIRAEWSLVVKRLSALDGALDDAGADPATYDPKKPPGDVTEEEQAMIAAAATALGDPETVEAMSSIEQQALDVCKTSLYG
ncbi:hypothetical protein GCM10027026_01590 [Myroides odoratimimus subsp. xuanwuensis]